MVAFNHSSRRRLPTGTTWSGRPPAASGCDPPRARGWHVRDERGGVGEQVGRLERPPYDFALQLDEAGAGPHTARMISKCLARPDRRYPSACELLDDLETSRDGVTWDVPDGCYDVSAAAEKYLAARFG